MIADQIEKLRGNRYNSKRGITAVRPALTIGRRHGIYQLMKSRLTSGLALTRPEYRQRWFGGASCGHVMLVNIGQPSRCGGVPPG